MKLNLIPVTVCILVLFGCRNTYYSEKDFLSVPKIDSHIHINSSDGAFEDQAAADNFILITLNVDHSDSANIVKQYENALQSVKNHPGKIFFGPTFLFDTAGWGTEEWSKRAIAQLDREISAPGVITVKFWKNIGMTVRDRNGKFIMVDDPGLQPVIQFIKSKGFFARNPQYHMFLHPDYPSYEDQIRARDNMLAKNPDLTFIGCHLGSLEYDVDSLAARLDRFPNMAVDMSARICHLQYQSARDRERVRNFCIKYQDRLLYGTDVGYSGSNNPEAFKKGMHNTWLDDWKYFTTSDEMTSGKFDGKFLGLKLPKKVVDKIYRENAVKWYKLKI
jgi:predicted TIM-barrel fold metal-dependent hydrolase